MKRSAMVEGVFPHPNMLNFKCQICGGAEDRPVVLIPIVGTQEGNLCEAEQIHVDCLLSGLIYYPSSGVIAVICRAGKVAE